MSIQRQRCDGASDTGPIKNNLVAPKLVATPFGSDSIVFREVSLSQSFSVNGPLIFQAVIAHTEDGCLEWKDYGYVVNAHIKPTERNSYTEERFLAFCYPGEQNKITILLLAASDFSSETNESFVNFVTCRNTSWLCLFSKPVWFSDYRQCCKIQ